MSTYRVWEAYEIRKTVIRKVIIEANSPEEAKRLVESTECHGDEIDRIESDYDATPSGFHVSMASDPELDEDRWKAVDDLDGKEPLSIGEVI